MAYSLVARILVVFITMKMAVSWRRMVFGGRSRTTLRSASSLNALPLRKVEGERPAIKVVLKPAPQDEAPVARKLSAAEFRKEHQVTIKGEKAGGAIEPWTDFNETPFGPTLKRVLTTAGYTAPTTIQALSWPIALEKRDLISVARTGSGKTCGFLLPALHNILMERDADKFEAQKRYNTRGRKIPSVLVLAPTRELAVQIETEAQKFARAANAFVMSMYGGASKGAQIQKLRAGVDIVVATPGRCNDLLEMGVLNLSAIKYLVLDEADRMLDMGFEPQIRSIIDQIPEERQSLFFTATWPKEVQSLAADFLKSPVHISVGDSESLTANKAIRQHVIVCSERDKDAELDRVIERINPSADPNLVPKTIVFMNRKHACDDLAFNLRGRGYAVDTLHGDKSQALRTIAMQRFRNGRLRILVATDVAARGLDVHDVEVVVNHDMPNNVEDYVHRIGRTARGSASGDSFTFFTRNDEERARELAGVLERSGQEVPPALQAMLLRGRRSTSSGAPSRFGGRGKFGGAPRSQSGAREWRPSQGKSQGGRGGGEGEDRSRRDWGRPQRDRDESGESRPPSKARSSFNFGDRSATRPSKVL